MCDHCVVLLLDDLERAGALLPAIREQLSGINASSVAWARLHRLNASITNLQVLPCLTPRHPLLACIPTHPGSQTHLLLPQSQLRNPPGPHYETIQQLEALEQQTSSLGQDTQHLDGRASPWGLPPQNPWNTPPPEKPPLPLSQIFAEKSLSSGPKPSRVTHP